MATKEIPGQLSFDDDPNNLKPLPPAPQTRRISHGDGYVDVPHTEGVANKVEDYARNLLLASIALDSAAQPRGLRKADATIKGKREQLKATYQKKMGAEHAYEFVVLPGSQNKKVKKLNRAEELVDAAIGDIEAARDAALRGFSDEERAAIELSADFVERDDLRNSFMNKMKDSTKDPNSKAKPENKPTLGLKNRRELQKRMKGHLRRLGELQDPDQKAA